MNPASPTQPALPIPRGVPIPPISFWFLVSSSNRMISRNSQPETLAWTAKDASRDTPVSLRGLRLSDDVRVGFFDTVDGVDLCDHDVGERPFVMDIDEDKDIRAAEARVGLFHAGDAFE